MYLKLAYLHCFLWYVRNSHWMLLAESMGIGSWYDAAEFARNKGVHTPASRRWLAENEPYNPDKSQPQLDYERLQRLMARDPDDSLSQLDHTTAHMANSGRHGGEFSQMDRMLFEAHEFKIRRGFPTLIRIQLSNKARAPWYADVVKVAQRIGTSLPYGKRFTDAFQELGVDSKTAYKLCRQAQLDPTIAIEHLEILASELHKISLTTDERLELGFDCETVCA